MSHRPSPKRTVLAIGFVGLLFVSLLAVAPASAAAQSTETNTSTATDTATATSCDGTPQMSQTSIALLDDTITADSGATVEANFRPESTLPEECTIVVDLEFSFTQSGFQFGGGSNWDQATTNLVATQFEVRPGEIRDIRAQLYTNGAEPGDEVTVIADYELWYQGNRDNSVQQSGIRKTIDVEAVNDGPSTTTETDSGENTPDQSEAVTATSDDDDGLLGFVSDNLGLLSVFTLGLVATVGLVFRKPIVQVITGQN